MSLLFRVNMDVSVRARTEHEAIDLALRMVAHNLQCEEVECCAVHEIDETPTDAELAADTEGSYPTAAERHEDAGRQQRELKRGFA